MSPQPKNIAASRGARWAAYRAGRSIAVVVVGVLLLGFVAWGMPAQAFQVPPTVSGTTLTFGSGLTVTGSITTTPGAAGTVTNSLASTAGAGANFTNTVYGYSAADYTPTVPATAEALLPLLLSLIHISEPTRPY